MHSKGIVHRNINDYTVEVDSENNASLGSFQKSMYVPSSKNANNDIYKTLPL